jgi:hypothetical protein
MPVTVSGSYKATHPGWDRGMQSTMHCGNNPESWVRASASLIGNSLHIQLQLETDSVDAGPKGRAIVTLRDANGKQIATATTSEAAIGGKPPGHAIIQNFGSTVDIDPNVANRVVSMYVDAQCTGSNKALWGINLGDLAHAFQIIVAAAAAVGE